MFGYTFGSFLVASKPANAFAKTVWVYSWFFGCALASYKVASKPANAFVQSV